MDILAGVKTSDSKYKVSTDNAAQWRWRLVSSNGRIIADSGQGYASRTSCLEGIDLVKATVNAEVIDE